MGVAVERHASPRSSVSWLGCLADGTHLQERWGGLRGGACGGGGWCEPQGCWRRLS